jgi:hypothetical protein
VGVSVNVAVGELVALGEGLGLGVKVEVLVAVGGSLVWVPVGAGVVVAAGASSPGSEQARVNVAMQNKMSACFRMILFYIFFFILQSPNPEKIFNPQITQISQIFKCILRAF